MNTGWYFQPLYGQCWMCGAPGRPVKVGGRTVYFACETPYCAMEGFESRSPDFTNRPPPPPPPVEMCGVGG